MIKPDSLRKAIEDVLPGLSINPDRLKMWIDKGSATGRMTETLGFCWTYRLSILVEGMVENPSIIAIAIIQWLRVNQPELLTPGQKAFDFDVDIIDNVTADFGVDLELSEMVSAVQREDGGFDMVHLPEPDPLFDDFTALSPDENADGLTQAWLTTGEKLLPDTPPLGADVQPPGAFPA